MARAAVDGPFTADLSKRPYVRVFSPQVPFYESVSIPSYFEWVDRALARAEPFVVLHDVRDIPPVDDARRCAFMAELEHRRARVDALLLGYAALVSSPLERGIVTAFAWFARVPAPVRLFSRESEATNWLDARLGSLRHLPAVT